MPEAHRNAQRAVPLHQDGEPHAERRVRRVRDAQEHVPENKKGLMHFLELIRDRLCCAPEHAVLERGRTLCCTACRRVVIPDLFEYVEEPDSGDYFRSGLLARTLAEWIGNEDVPVSFPVSHVDGILDRIVRRQSLRRVHKSIRLLRAVNAPFTTDPSAASSCPDDVRTFLTDFLGIVEENPAPDASDERIALETLMRNMHDLVATKDAPNPFEPYFGVLVPYVQTCAEWEAFTAEPPDPNPASELHLQLVRSHLIRKVFSQYAIPFDVIHVMICCYACSSDVEVVGNWAIDFVARVCRGDFDWKRYADSPFVVRMLKLVHSRYTFKRNKDLYHNVVKPIARGEAIEHYSKILRPLSEMKLSLRKDYFVPGVWSSDVLDMAFLQVFPAVLFGDYADQMGFTLGFNHLMTSANKTTGELPPKAPKKAKLIHGVVMRFIRKIEDFHDDGSPCKEEKLVWNLDTVRMFFASDPHFHDEIMNVLRILIGKDEG